MPDIDLAFLLHNTDIDVNIGFFDILAQWSLIQSTAKVVPPVNTLYPCAIEDCWAFVCRSTMSQPCIRKMKSTDHSHKQLKRLTTALLAVAWFITGCSGSADSDGGVMQSTVDPVSTNINSDNSNLANDSNLNEGDTGSEFNDTENGENTSPESAPEGSQSTVQVTTLDDEPVENNAMPEETMEDKTVPVGISSETVETSSVVPDPLIRNSTQVDFNISVPVYQSNALQVRVVWGEFNSSLAWVGDELWSLSTELPTNTEHPLIITFSDNNGSIELGSFEQTYKTGTNAAETVQVRADQFDTARWDTDADGVSNLVELLAGNNPLVDESLSLDIRESLGFDTQRTVSLISERSELFEVFIPDERPYFEDEQTVTPHEFPNWGTLFDRTTFTIDIDATGNGTFTDFERIEHDPGDHTTVSMEGTRTKSDTSIQWSGSSFRFSRQAACNPFDDEFSFEISTTDADLIGLDGVQMHRGNCSSLDDNLDISYSITGVRIAESEFCEATAGTITGRSVFSSTNEHTISKTSEEPFWNVVSLNADGELVEEYQVASIGLNFYCVICHLSSCSRCQ